MPDVGIDGDGRDVRGERNGRTLHFERLAATVSARERLKLRRAEHVVEAELLGDMRRHFGVCPPHLQRSRHAAAGAHDGGESAERTAV